MASLSSGAHIEKSASTEEQIEQNESFGLPPLKTFLFSKPFSLELNGQTSPTKM